MRLEAWWRRSWIDVTGHRIALAVALPGFLLVVFNAGPDSLDSFGFLLGAALVGGPALWIAAGVYRAGARRKRLRDGLLTALAANGDDIGAAADLFPDVPICLTRTRLYCAMDRDIDVQPLDAIAWAYAEHFIMRPYRQIVIWNTSASANVLPIRERYIAPALDRLKAAAPWLPNGYNQVMKETWNADHADFLALVAARRDAGLPFDAPWTGQGYARVAAMPSSDMATDWEKEREDRAEKRLTAHWDEGKN